MLALRAVGAPITGVYVAYALARMPDGATWSSVFGVAILCGIGFTMSLFIANLAFAESAPVLAVGAVVGILAASLVAAVAGYLVLAIALARPSLSADLPPSV